MSPTEIGRAAEERACALLEDQDFQIIERNWRNRWCELDIVARKGSAIHFIEVKYRRSTTFGSPLDYITPDKLARLSRAVAAWCQARSYQGDRQIDIVSVSPDSIEHIPAIEL